ncbi:hypothetical protein DL98DRAFT_625996 [Cadophora sp. DSE1049]|nr:hypothetical protein DL98DRAFT_625996 [Cadophora sp. DSE1049]
MSAFDDQITRSKQPSRSSAITNQNDLIDISEPPNIDIEEPEPPAPPTFTCPHPSCTKSFLRREHLTRHSRSHAPEKPYKCLHCPKAFARSDILKRHTLLHTPTSSSAPFPPKRTKIACFHCRRRRLKCDAKSPCMACVLAVLDCSREEADASSQPLPTEQRVSLVGGEGRRGELGTQDVGVGAGLRRRNVRVEGLKGGSGRKEDGGMEELTAKTVDLRIEGFGSQGWCPGKAATRFWMMAVS